MDPLTPTTSTLSPAIAHIAETARSLAGSLQDRSVDSGKAQNLMKKRKQQETVRWVLATPQRLQDLIEEGKREEARSDWEEIELLLQQWDGAAGVSDLKEQCLNTLGKSLPDVTP